MSGPYRTHLEVIDVASPCTEDWSKMDGDDAVRFCLKCSNNVYDLTQRTKQEIDALLALHEGDGVCVRMHRRRDGTLVTADCAPARRAFFRHALRRYAAIATVTAICASAASTLFALVADDASASRARLKYVAPPLAERHADADPGGEVVMGMLRER